MRFVALSLETHADGECADYLYIYDGNRRFGKLCEGNPRPIVTTGSTLDLELNTDDLSADKGFKLEWTVVGRYTYCTHVHDIVR